MSASRPVRYGCDLVTELKTHEGVLAQTRLLELSESGAFVEETAAIDSLQVGDALTLAMALPGGEPWLAHARVHRVGAARKELPSSSADHLTISIRGYALVFDPLPDEDLEQLRDFLELLDSR